MAEQSDSIMDRSHSSSQAVTVTLALPLDVAQTIRDRAKQLGRSPASLMVELLRSGLELTPDRIHSTDQRSPETWQTVNSRLAALETMAPKVDDLLAKVNRLLDEQPTRPPLHSALNSALDSAPPAVEATSLSMPVNSRQPDDTNEDDLELCPRCDRSLGAPLKSSGRQVCRHCGWTNRPRSAPSAPPSNEISSADIQSILAKAAEESLKNMKRNKTQKPPKPGGKDSRFPDLPPFS